MELQPFGQSRPLRGGNLARTPRVDTETVHNSGTNPNLLYSLAIAC